MTLSKKTLRAITFPIVVLLLISFAGLVRAAVHYSCGNDGDIYANFWYRDIGCTDPSGTTPNLGGDSNDIYISSTFGDRSIVSIQDGNVTLDGNDQLIIESTDGNEFVVASGGALNISGGALTINSGASLTITSSGNITFTSGTVNLWSGANLSNENVQGKEITFGELPFSASLPSSEGQEVSANVLAFSSTGDFF